MEQSEGEEHGADPGEDLTQGDAESTETVIGKKNVGPPADNCGEDAEDKIENYFPGELKFVFGIRLIHWIPSPFICFFRKSVSAPAAPDLWRE